MPPNRRKQSKPRYNPIGRRAPRMMRRNLGTSSLTQRHISGPTFHKIRIGVTQSGTFNFRGDYLLAAAGVISAGTGSAYTLNESGRVTYCRVIGVPPTSGSISTVKLEFQGGNDSVSGTRDLIVNSSNNPVTAPTIYAKPKKTSQSSSWFNNSVFGNLISIEAPTNTIIEIGLVVMQPEQGHTLSPTTVVGTPFAGANRFYRYIATVGCTVIT